jgi:hypothetical protein
MYKMEQQKLDKDTAKYDAWVASWFTYDGCMP